ncbi:MAG TPA: hypothetical protein VNP95_05350, partial [Thermomicrobiales bacterium]|nr:hypothetical protein [Thermomicrobiales bacterium]
ATAVVTVTGTKAPTDPKAPTKPAVTQVQALPNTGQGPRGDRDSLAGSLVLLAMIAGVGGVVVVTRRSRHDVP